MWSDVSDMQRYDPAIKKDRNILKQDTGGVRTMTMMIIIDIQKGTEGDGIWESFRRQAIHL